MNVEIFAKFTYMTNKAILNYLYNFGFMKILSHHSEICIIRPDFSITFYVISKFGHIVSSNVKLSFIKFTEKNRFS